MCGQKVLHSIQNLKQYCFNDLRHNNIRLMGEKNYFSYRFHIMITREMTELHGRRIAPDEPWKQSAYHLTSLRFDALTCKLKDFGPNDFQYFC